MSPVGNKIVSYDLKNNRSQCLGLEAEYNVEHLSTSPDGRLVLAGTEKGHLYMLSMVSQTVLHRKHYAHWGSISVLSFSPDGRFYVVCGGSVALIYSAPDPDARHLSPFGVHKVLKAHFDDITCVAWSPNSSLIAVGSKDFTVKIFAVTSEAINTRKLINLSGHGDHIIGCFFSGITGSYYDLYSIDQKGTLSVWEASFRNENELSLVKENEEEEPTTLTLSRKSKHYLQDHVKDKNNPRFIKLTAAKYNAVSKIVVTGYSNGCFLLQDIPDLNVIYSLQMSNNAHIDSLVMNPSGEWIGIGCGVGHGSRDQELDSPGSTSSTQLVVWEWKSETFVMKQSGTGAGVANLTECSAFSPDGLILATGGTDAKIRLYDTMTGFCFVTFGHEHRGPITGLEFVSKKGGKVLASSSLDGTVRCFDLNRYRNFKTFSGVDERSPQFICLAVDSLSGDFIAAGAQNTYEIYMWSQQTGRLVEVLAGHTAPVSGIKFSPTGSDLISCSWDGTIRIWGLFQASKSSREVIKVGFDCISLAMTLCGSHVAVSTVNGQIYFFDATSGEQMGIPIEGKSDLGSTMAEEETSRDKDKYFRSLTFSADGEFILGGGNAKNICLYHRREKMLVKKFAVTFNQSMDGMFDHISRRKRAEFGFNQALIRSRVDGEYHSSIALPGVKSGDLSERSVNPTICVTTVSFAPTMRSFVAATTEGVLLFSLDSVSLFDPFGLEVGITEDSVRQLIGSQEYLHALVQAIKLNRTPLICEVFESVPVSDIPFIASSIPSSSLETVLKNIALALESSRHLEFYTVWTNEILRQHAIFIKNNQMTSGSMMAVLRLLSRSLTKHFDDVGKLVDICHHSLNLVISMNETQAAKT